VKSASDIFSSSSARRSSADHTMELVPSASGRKASVPSRMKRCHAVAWCGRVVDTVATMAV